METTVKQIHDEVDNAIEVLLQESPYDRFKANYLSALGFSASENVRDAQDHQEHHKDARFYSQKYPQYKFITDHQFGKIRAKYDLQSEEFSRFKGAIPEKNIKEMMGFTILAKHIREETPSHYADINSLTSRWMDILTTGTGYHVRSEYSSEPRLSPELRLPPIYPRLYGPENFTEQFKRNAEKAAQKNPDQEICNLIDIANRFPRAIMITADKSLFLAPVRLRCPIVTVAVTGGRLIVTAWGAEALDPDVLNEKMN